MTPKADIIQGGGWVVEKTVGRPKARFFTFLSVAWLPVSLCAALLIWLLPPQPARCAWWTCCLLFALEPVLVCVAAGFGLLEKTRGITRQLPNPDYDQHNLY